MSYYVGLLVGAIIIPVAIASGYAIGEHGKEAQKPPPTVRWYPVPNSREVIQGERFNLICSQTVNREALAVEASVDLESGDRVRTTCVAVLASRATT
jgi:hypothetical protein